MKKLIAVAFQIVIVLIGIFALALLLIEPHFEGRNVNATLFEIYARDPFLAYAYVASVAFFIGLYQAFKLVGYVGRNMVFSQASIKALKTIKYCALSMIGFIIGAEAYMWIAIRGTDDIAGGVAMGLLLMAISVIVVISAGTLEGRVRRAIAPKNR